MGGKLFSWAFLSLKALLKMTIQEVDLVFSVVSHACVHIFFITSLSAFIFKILETKVEAVPGLLHDLFDRLCQKEIIPTKPDYCVIDYYNEVSCFHSIYCFCLTWILTRIK